MCTGSLVYAAAGLLTHRPATTHWASLDTLAELDPTIDVRRDERYVDDGDIIAAAGVSAGIDMALHLVVRLAGVERARQVKRYIQYDPDPPVERRKRDDGHRYSGTSAPVSVRHIRFRSSAVTCTLTSRTAPPSADISAIPS